MGVVCRKLVAARPGGFSDSITLPLDQFPGAGSGPDGPEQWHPDGDRGERPGEPELVGVRGWRERPGQHQPVQAHLQYRSDPCVLLHQRDPAPPGDGHELHPHGADQRDHLRLPGLCHRCRGESLDGGHGECDAAGFRYDGAHWLYYDQCQRRHQRARQRLRPVDLRRGRGHHAHLPLRVSLGGSSTLLCRYSIRI